MLILGGKTLDYTEYASAKGAGFGRRSASIGRTHKCGEGSKSFGLPDSGGTLPIPRALNVCVAERPLRYYCRRNKLFAAAHLLSDELSEALGVARYRSMFCLFTHPLEPLSVGLFLLPA